MYICIYTYIHTYIYIYTFVFLKVHMNIYIFTHICRIMGKVRPFLLCHFLGTGGALPGHARIADHSRTALFFFGGGGNFFDHNHENIDCPDLA